MTTTLLIRNTLSAEDFAWLQKKYLAVDGMNLEGYGVFLADGCTLEFGNNPKAKGKVEVLEGLRQFWQQIHGLNHHFVNVYGTAQAMVLEAHIDYTRKDERVVRVPCVSIVERNVAGLAQSVRIFLDTTPVFA
jgi:hypothetical protein